MDYPIWNVPYLGGAMVIAGIAIVNVFIAHFALGAGLFNAITETFCLKTSNGTLKQFLRDNSRLIVLFPFVVGILFAAAMWFSIILVSPETTFMLVRLFLWAWAIEWLCLLVQVIAGYLYHYTWDTLSPRTHCLLGWVYALAGWIALVFLNGILTFMLTPGAALDTAGATSGTPVTFDFWPALFNPTYAPSLIMRTVGSLTLAALFAMILVNASKKYNTDRRRLVTNHAAGFLIPMAIIIPATFWYLARVPALSIFYLKGGAIIMTTLLIFSALLAGCLALYGYIALVIRKRAIDLETALLLTVLALVSLGSAEFVREGIRKPFLIYDHMYSTGMLKAQLPSLNDAQHTMLQYAPWAVQPNHTNVIDTDITDENFLNFDHPLFTKPSRLSTYPEQSVRGRWLYDAQCLRCHTLDGYNAARPLVTGWSLKTANHSLEHLAEIKPAMPPFVGTIRDRNDLAMYMHYLNGPCTKCHLDIDDLGNLEPGKKESALKDNWENALP